MTSSRLVAPELAAVQIDGLTRQAFLMRATLAAGATYGVSMVTPFVTAALAQEGGGDVDILNFALTLEHLEEHFYEQALEEVDGLGEKEKTLVEKLRDDESAHVEALQATIKDMGGEPVKRPRLDFGNAFGDKATFLKTASTFEDTGVSAYNGAAPNIQSKEVLAAAGSIVQIEGRHAALIRFTRGASPAPRAFDKASQMQEVLDAVTPFIKS